MEESEPGEKNEDGRNEEDEDGKNKKNEKDEKSEKNEEDGKGVRSDRHGLLSNWPVGVVSYQVGRRVYLEVVQNGKNHAADDDDGEEER